MFGILNYHQLAFIFILFYQCVLSGC